MIIRDQSHTLLNQPPATYDDTLKFIEKIGRICYQSSDKITQDSAKKFVEKQLVPSGHHAMIEHSWLVLRKKFSGFENKAGYNAYVEALAAFTSNFLTVGFEGEYLYIAGNWRAYIDMFCKDFDEFTDMFLRMPEVMVKFRKSWEIVPIDEIPMKFRAYSVVFITDRAVTHELVRHRPASYAQKSQRYCADRKNLEFIRPHMFDYADTIGIDDNPKYKEWLQACEDAELSYHRLLEMGQKPQEARAVLPNSVLTEIAVTASISEWEHIFALRCARDAYPQIRRLIIPVLKYFTDNKLTDKIYRDSHYII